MDVVKNFETSEAGIISDQAVKFRHKTQNAEKKNSYINDTPLILLTNRFDLTAIQIANLYKERL